MIELTEAYITQRLQAALQPAQVASDGHSNPATNAIQPPKCAAVLIPLARFADEWHLLYTRRTDIVDSHKGQVSFPGGACDDGETTAEQTALREAEEEIGLRPRDVRVLGRLNDLVTITSFQVTPVVGVIPWPYSFKVATVEVARVFTMPVSWLAEKKNRWEFKLPGREYGLIVYHPYDGELLWGATAVMTDMFLNVLGI